MAVAIQDVSTAFVRTGAATTYSGTANITVTGSLSNPAMTIMLVFDIPVPSVTGVHWDSAGANQALTLIGQATNTTASACVQLWAMIGQPTAGNKNLLINAFVSSECLLFAETWTGVTQASLAAAFANFVSTSNSTLASNATGTLNVTSAVGDAVLAGWVNDLNWASVNNTQLFLDNTGANLETASNRAAGAASVAMTATNGATAVNYAAVGVNIVASGGAAAAPFVQSIWEKAALLVTKPDLNRPLNVNLFINPIPFVSTDRPRVVPVPLVPPPQSLPLNINLYTNPIPVNNTMLLIGSSKVKYVLSDSTDPSEMWLFPQVIVAPFYTQDFSTSRILPNWLPSPTYPNLTVINTKPFDNSTPGRMWTIIAGPPQSLPLNLNLFTNPIPFAQYDWSTYRNVPDWLPPTAYPNLVVNTTIVFNPFIPIDYNRTFTPVPAKPDQQALNINLYTNPIPFGPYDYPRISSVRYTPFDANGLPNLVLQSFSTPFVSYDWSKPRAVKASIDPQYPNFVILQPVGSPFSQLDWSKAYTISPKASNQNEVPNLLLIQPSIPGRPLGLSSWLNIGYVKSPVIIVPDQNNLPNIVLPNTSPVPPVIFIPGGKTVWVPRWGEKQRRQYGDREAFNEVRKAAAVLSSLGGHARAKSLTSKERSNIASIAAKARWR